MGIMRIFAHTITRFDDIFRRMDEIKEDITTEIIENVKKDRKLFWKL